MNIVEPPRICHGLGGKGGHVWRIIPYSSSEAEHSLDATHHRHLMWSTLSVSGSIPGGGSSFDCMFLGALS